MKQAYTFLFLTFVSIFGIAQNTLPPSGNVGIGTTSPSSELEVMGTTTLGAVKVKDSATFEFPVKIKDSVSIESKLTVDQDVKIKGQTVFVDQATAKADLKILGTTKMKGDAVVEGSFKFKGLEDSSATDDRFLMINANGKATSLEKAGLLGTIYSSNLCLVDGNGNFPAPVWSNVQGIGGAPGILYTADACPGNVGIGTSTPTAKLDVSGSGHFSGSIGVVIQ